MSLLPKLSKYLDTHLTIRVLSELEGRNVYDEAELKATLKSVLTQTKMLKILDVIDDEKEKAEADSRLKTECERVEKIREFVNPLLAMVESPEKLEDLKKCTSVGGMQEQYGISLKMLEDFYGWVHDNYDFGLYQLALSGLTGYSSFATKLTDHPPSFARSLQMRWGVLACNILEKNWGPAAATIMQLDEVMDTECPEWNQAEVMRQRSWLLHWALFVIFKTPADQQGVLNKVYEWFSSEKCLSAISFECPHLLRYVSAAFILNRKLFASLQKDLPHVLAQEADAYSDALTEFVLALHQDMDFEVAQQKLHEMVELCSKDYFLFDLVDQIKGNARQNVFSSFCQIHRCVNISTIADKMGMDSAQAEDWIVDLIQSGKLNATITPTEAGELSVEFQKPEQDVSTVVEERTRQVGSRIFLLAANAEAIVKPHKLASKLIDIGGKLARFSN